MNIFNFLRRKPKVNGIIKYLNLEDWWINELSDEERKLILNTYSSMGSNRSIIEGEVCSSTQTPLHFFWGLIGWFNKPGLRHIAYKLIAKAETLIDKQSDPLDVHFLYGEKIKVYYKDRNLLPDSLGVAIRGCEQQIHNAPRAAEAFIQKFGGKLKLPVHLGYNQLAIILEKQKRYTEVISLCEKAKSQEWVGDWDKRIERCKKRNNA